MKADGSCLFNSVSFGIIGNQSNAKVFRMRALKFITENAQHFEEDIRNTTGKSVQEYVEHMTPDFAFGDAIMIIAMCLDFKLL